MDPRSIYSPYPDIHRRSLMELYRESQHGEFRLPMALIGVGLVVYCGIGLYDGGASGAANTIWLLTLQALVFSILGLISCYLVAALLHTSFGTFQSAVPKLAAVSIFPLAAAILVLLISPLASLMVIIALTFWLLKSLFDLEMFELSVLSITLLLMHWLTEMAIDRLVDSNMAAGFCVARRAASQSAELWLRFEQLVSGFLMT